GVQQLPEPLGAAARQGGLDVHRAAQPGDILRGVISPAPLPTRVRLPPVAQLVDFRCTVAVHDQSLPIEKNYSRLWAHIEAGTQYLACRDDRRGMRGRLAGQLRKKLISGKREEFDECRAGGDLVENLSCERILALVIRFRADVRSNLAQFLVHEAAEQLGGDLAAVVEHASGMPD